MKIKDQRLFTYPVLANGRDDYKTCKFFAKATPHTTADAAGNLVFDVDLSTDCAEINRLIINGDAEYLFHVECPTTIYRKIFTNAVGKFSCKIPLSLVKDTLYLVAFIVLRRDVKNFFCADWNDDFDGLKFDLQRGSILAYKNFETLTLVEDPNLFKNVGSIFSIYRKLADDVPFEINLTTQKIKIGLNAKDYDLYRRYYANPTLQPILNAMIILPALVSIFAELKQDAQEHESDAWFSALKAVYGRQKLDFNKLLAEEDSLTLAQEVMGLPITGALQNIAQIVDTEDS
ncbi:MAG: hypothetical protein IJ685_13810 [Selenomonadaceae bacterium]|nr:hypothetical protein [Selenomonadaceae bacterium]